MMQLEKFGNLMLLVFVFFGSALGTFAELENVKQKCLTENEFFQLTNRTETIISCDSKGLTKIPEVLQKNATKFNFGSNLLSTLEDDFSSFASLKKASFSNNQIRCISENAFKNMTSLVELWLSGNRLSTLPENLLSLPSLEVLMLQSNQLTTFSYGRSISPLKILYLFDNPITSFITLGNSRSLASLDLSSTNITRITVNDLQASPSLMYVRFAKTPFDDKFVRCENEELIDFILSGKSKIRNFPEEYLHREISCVENELAKNMYEISD